MDSDALDPMNLIEWLHEQIAYEKRMLARCSNINSSGAGMAIGAHDAYARVIDFIESDGEE